MCWLSSSSPTGVLFDFLHRIFCASTAIARARSTSTILRLGCLDLMAVNLITEGRAVQLPTEEPYWENWDSMVIEVDEHNRAAFASWGCKHFAGPEPGEKYKASTMLQVFCLRFATDILMGGPMEVYGFVAVRDDVNLRNYIFNLPREEAVTLDSSVLPLISPVRGMSVWNNALVEINLKAKKNEKSDDLILIDSCIEFRWNRIIRDKKLKSRIDGPFGAFEMEYMFIKHGIEAVVEVDIHLELIGDHVLIVARSTGFKQEVIIYDDVVKEETRKISAVIVASHGGSLHFGFLATGIRASADFIKFQVKKSGSHEGYLFILKEPQSAMLNYEPHDILVVDSCLPRESLQLPQKKGRILALRRSANDPGVIRVPFKVTFSTMGYYNNGML